MKPFAAWDDLEVTWNSQLYSWDGHARKLPRSKKASVFVPTSRAHVRSPRASHSALSPFVAPEILASVVQWDDMFVAWDDLTHTWNGSEVRKSQAPTSSIFTSPPVAFVFTSHGANVST
jgi:hypothetical protein